MKKIRNLRFDDNDDLSLPSRAVGEVSASICLLDYARRVYERRNDSLSQKKAIELRRCIRKLWLISTDANWAIIGDDIINEYQ